LVETQNNTGTNEVRLLVFRLRDTYFAVDVLNIREIIKQNRIISIPNAPEAIEGVFKLRDEVIPLVGLGRYLGFEKQEAESGVGAIVIVNISGVKCGLLVDAVDVIKATTSDKIQAPSRFLTDAHAPITGTIEIDGRTVQIPDLVTLTGEIFSTDTKRTLSEAGAKVDTTPEDTEAERGDSPYELDYMEGTPSFENILKGIPQEQLNESPDEIGRLESESDDDSGEMEFEEPPTACSLPENQIENIMNSSADGTMHFDQIVGEISKFLAKDDEDSDPVKLEAESGDEGNSSKLAEIASEVKNSRRASADFIKETILRLTRENYLTADEIADLLGRKTDYLRSKFLNPLFNDGQINLKYPQVINHPNQAYLASDDKS